MTSVNLKRNLEKLKRVRWRTGQVLTPRHFRAQQDNTWRLSDEIIPPLLTVGATPYLTERLKDLRNRLIELDVLLRHQLLDLHAQGESVRAVQRARIEARKLDASLSDIDSRVGLHPYLVYSWLRAFWLELYLLSEAVPDDVIPAASTLPYHHDDLGACFSSVLNGINERVRHEQPLRWAETRPFEPDGNLLVAKDLPSEALNASELYLLVQKPSAETTASRLSPDLHSAGSPPRSEQNRPLPVSMERVRLAAPERLQGATDHSIGVKIKHVKNTRLVNAFGPWFDFYEVERNDPYWTEIKINRAVALANQGRFAGVKMVLYWRRVPGSHRA